jgi:NAD(P) transhydrogenase
MKLVFRVDDGVILGVHILGDDACEMIHYGMDLVTEEVTIFKVMTTCFTAVTFHELFKEAALAGNNQLEFGM